uniref:protein ALP1-like n=1 Tax=Erigeron canadensis TaxID=72917 RepID=UPI001CB9854C|nr:protein ALP1-like [Erigeron canadensis]
MCMKRVHGFPGMIGSIDYMHWPWEMCPTAWRSTHTRGDLGRPSLIIQGVALYDLWIWNAYFGPQGSHNDINVFESSPVLEDLISGLTPSASFYANGNFYQRGYYLGDGIYPEYATFIKTFTDPVDEKRKLFKKKQESERKGIERAFGVLKKRWKVLNHPAHYWDKELMQDVIYACIILHNMILEDEGKATCQDYNPDEPSLVPGYWEQMTPLEQRIQNRHAIKSRETHNMLTADLIDHLWTTQAHDFDPDNVVLPDLNEYVSSDDE